MENLKNTINQKILVFIPSYGDAVELPNLIHSIRKLGNNYVPLFIDDGSIIPITIKFDKILSVRLPENFGLGVCTHIAFDYALRHNYDVVVRIDSDGQHQVEDIPKLIQELGLSGANLVIGERINHYKSKNLSGYTRGVLKFYFNLVARALTKGTAPKDVNSGFFAADHKTIVTLSNRSFERFPEPEIYISACRSGLKLSSIMIKQKPRTDGKTTLSLISAMRMFFGFNVFAFNELLRRKKL